LRYDHTEQLYGSLINITERLIKGTLDDADPEALVELSEEHRKVMGAIQASGFSRDPKLLKLIMEASRKTREMIAELKRQLNETGSDLKSVGNRKKLHGAYRRM